ncbi:MAG: hypothetical protein KGI38_02450 [Thaumarchaeota archaeon]|nr:hypothetical protein [Nitrososphaerota archaeon]
MPAEDPHTRRVNPNVLGSEPEEIQLVAVDWDSIRVEIVGEVPAPGKKEGKTS